MLDAPHDRPPGGLLASLKRQAPLRQCLAGAAAGLIVFFLLEAMRGTADLQGGEAPSGDYLTWRGNVFFVGAVFGAVVTALLVLAQEWVTGAMTRTLQRGFVGAVIGAVLSIGYSILGNALFAVFAFAAGDDGAARVFGRAAGWSLFGLGTGLAAGLSTRSLKRAYLGCAGGLGGGLLGGAFFSLIDRDGAGGPAARLVGYVVPGAAIGLATALAEEFARVAWITPLTGPREGYQIPLYQDALSLGRDETAGLPLFGDPQVEPHHANLLLSPVPAIRAESDSAVVLLDGHPIREAPLYDGALIQIGRHRFRFHHRTIVASSEVFSAAHGMVHAPWTALPGSPADLARRDAGQLQPPVAADAPGPSPAEVTLMSASPGTQETTLLSSTPGKPVLRILTGQGAGAGLPLGDAPIALGRETANTLPIPDARVSRYHARIDFDNGSWVLTDLDSRNGTFLNGIRVSRAGLAPGDRIYVGDTVLAVEVV